MSKAGRGQTVIDMALQCNGSAQEAWAIAIDMGVGLTDSIEGQDATNNHGGNKRVLRRYQQDQIHPASEPID